MTVAEREAQRARRKREKEDEAELLEAEVGIFSDLMGDKNAGKRAALKEVA